MKRRHPARRSRIVAAGLGATTMFGIVATLGLEGGSAHGQSTGGGVTAVSSSNSSDGASVWDATAAPTVRVVTQAPVAELPAAQVPMAITSGSR
jgi:hypothetical protein